MSTQSTSIPFIPPTPTEFEALPILSRQSCRARVFGDYLKSKPREETYSYASICHCALAQFGRAIYGEDLNSAGSVDVALNSIDAERIDVIDSTLRHTINGENGLVFGAVSDAYEVALAKAISKLKETA